MNFFGVITKHLGIYQNLFGDLICSDRGVNEFSETKYCAVEKPNISTETYDIQLSLGFYKFSNKIFPRS